MIKKTTLLIFILALVLSCGKKGDPEYKANKKVYYLFQTI